MEVSNLWSLIFFVIRLEDHDWRLYTNIQPFSQFLEPNAACTEFVPKFRIAPPPYS